MEAVFSQKLLWSRGGAGPELDRPNSLFEVTYTGEPGHWLLQRRACTSILRLVHGEQAGDDPEELGSNDIFSAFAKLVLALQNRAGIPVERFSVTMRERNVAWIAVEHLWPPSANLAAGLGAQYIEIMMGRRFASEADIIRSLFEFERGAAFSTYGHKALYAEALRRDIPVVMVPPRELAFGYGKFRRRLSGGTTEATPHLAVGIARNKSSTIDVLRNAGLPVPLHIPVKDPAEAVRAAARIGFPVVVKPVNTDQGVGITVGVGSRTEVDAAYRHAREFSDRIAVEEFIPGDTFRLLAIDGKFVAACRTQPTPVVGDGLHSIRQLVERINLSPLRGPDHSKPLSWLEIDEEAIRMLASMSLTPESVLPFGRTVRLRTASNLSRGGESISVNDIIHPDNRKLAELCAKVTGLDIAGIDFRIDAIETSYKSSRCGVIEVNPNPGTRMHWRPARGPSAAVADATFELLFPGQARKRIPIVAVTGTNGKTTTVRMIAHIMRANGLVAGSTTTDEVTVGDTVISRGDSAGPGAARRVLSVPILDVAVLETARGGIVKHGLGFDRCDVAVITNIALDHVGELGVRTLEELAQVKSTVARTAENIVVNADDDLCLAIRAELSDKNAVLFSAQPGNPAIKEHLDAGGVAYLLSQAGGREMIVRREGRSIAELIGVTDLPLTLGGTARFNIQNAMAALAAVECLGIDPVAGCVAASTFMPDASCNAGRLNFVQGFPFEVLIDYAHNEPAFAAVAEFVAARACRGRKYCVVSMNSSRVTDAVGKQAMRPLAGCFDAFFTCTAGPKENRREEFPAALAQGLVGEGVSPASVTACSEQDDAIRRAIGQAQPGDLVAILDVYDVRHALRYLENLATKDAHLASG